MYFQIIFCCKPFVTYGTQIRPLLVIIWMLSGTITISFSLCLTKTLTCVICTTCKQNYYSNNSKTSLQKCATSHIYYSLLLGVHRTSEALICLEQGCCQSNRIIILQIRSNLQLGVSGLVVSVGLVTFMSWVQISLPAIFKQPWAVCSCQLSLLPFAGQEMSSSLRAMGWRPSVADWGGGMSVCCTAGPIVC